MSTFLYRVGKTAYRKPWYFILGWIVVLGIVGTMIGVNGMKTSSEMKIEGTEAQRVLDQLAEELPQAAGGSGSVIFKAPRDERLDTPERSAAIAKAVNEVYKQELVINPADYMTGSDDTASSSDASQSDASGQSADGAAAASGMLMSEGSPVLGVTLSADGKVALFKFQFTIALKSVPSDVLNSIVDTVMGAEKGTGLTVLPSESLAPLEITTGATEAIGIVVAAIVLFVTLGSMVAAGLPLLTAIFGVAVGVGGAFSISTFVNMTSVSSILALMIGLAVGIDYALFIVSRQRRLILGQGLGAMEAASRAIGTAGSAVFFAGLTVIIALSGMLVIGIGFLSTMALVAAATVFISVLIALTLLPALLGLVGERICSSKAREKHKKQEKAASRGVAEPWVKGVIKYRWLVIVGIVVVLGIAAIPIKDMELGIPGAGTANLDTPTRQSYDAIAEGFGEGSNGPLVLVAEPNDPSAKISAEQLSGMAQELQKLNNVVSVSPMGVNEEGNLAIFSLIPGTGPTDTATKDLVKALRASDLSIAQTYGVKIGVTGETAINIDMSAKLSEAFPIYVGIIMLLSIIILLLVFRSIIVPIKATAGFLLSILATFGITTAVFHWGWLHSVFGFDTGGPLLSFLPILVTGILYGLAMDYQVFLVSSMREAHVHGRKGLDSVVYGYKSASSVVVAAAVIMVSVFAGFIFTEDVMIKQIGFALTIGIFIDAFIVRMCLVPAVMAIFGNKAWWLPKWLDRILPNLDVEGDKLISQLNGEKHGQAKPLPKAN